MFRNTCSSPPTAFALVTVLFLLGLTWGASPAEEWQPMWRGDDLQWIGLSGHECLTQSFVVRPEQRLLRVEVLLRDGDDPADAGKVVNIALGAVWYVSVGKREIIETITVPSEQINGPTWVGIAPTTDRYNRPYYVQVWTDDDDYRQRVEMALCRHSDELFGRAGCAPDGVTLLAPNQDFYVRLVVEPAPEPEAYSCLRNGRFTSFIPERGTAAEPGLPACWWPVNENGACTFVLEPPGGFIQDAPSVAVVSAAEPAEGYWQQTVVTLTGAYTLSADVRVEGDAIARLAAGEYATEVMATDTWQRFSLPFETDGETDVRLEFRGAGKARFRDVTVIPTRLQTQPVPFQGGSTLGAITLPDNPSLPEQYAAWELQKHIHRMTGRVPGVLGRDQTYQGRQILIGRAAQPQLQEEFVSLPADSYLTAFDTATVSLVGNTDAGTLYAAYSFLRQQGCLWPLPGEENTIVPHREGLVLLDPLRIETPDYICRGFHMVTHQYNFGGTLIDWNMEDVVDWFVRNRLNSLYLTEYGETARFGPHHGESYQETMGHSHFKYMFPTRPEWWALVDGQRQLRHKSNRINNLCMSNEELRDWVAADVIQFFMAFPEVTSYALCHNDYVDWCECSPCRALDSDNGKGPWVKRSSGYPELPMTDRELNFVKDIADRVAEVLPDRKILTLAYGESLTPPQRERVPDNVRLVLCWHSYPTNRPTMESAETFARIDGWQKVGMKDYYLYFYGNYFNSDCPNFWFYHQTDYLKAFHEWGCRYALGESSNRLMGSMMWHQLRSRSYWDIDLDYQQEIGEISRRVYGPSAPAMLAYYTFMAQQEMDSLLWDQSSGEVASLNPDTLAIADGSVGIASMCFANFDFDEQKRGLALLEGALELAGDDEQRRLYVQREIMQHHIMTVALARNVRRVLPQDTANFIMNSFHQARELAQKFDARFHRRHLLGHLGLPTASLPTVPEDPEVVVELPTQWLFRIDPQDAGVAARWQAAPLKAEDWRPILVTRDWTTQGYAHHGTAWYALPLRLADALPDAAKRQRLTLLFGAVDGYADIYLDGELIGKQTVGPEMMWDRPFIIDLPEDCDWNVEHLLTVRVRKDRMAAGIWKPVSVIRSPEE